MIAKYTCGNCGITFSASSYRIYCSKSCSNKKNATHKRRRPTEGMKKGAKYKINPNNIVRKHVIICEWCKEEKPVASQKQKFCGIDCRNKYANSMKNKK